MMSKESVHVKRAGLQWCQAIPPVFTYLALLVKNVEMLLCCFLVTATEQLIEMPTPLECSSQYVTISTFIYRLCIFWLVTHSFMTLYLQSFNMFRQYKIHQQASPFFILQ